MCDAKEMTRQQEARLSEIMATLNDPDFGRFCTVEYGNLLVREANGIRASLGQPPLDPERYGTGQSDQQEAADE
jgi:hypothetical protein